MSPLLFFIIFRLWWSVGFMYLVVVWALILWWKEWQNFVPKRCVICYLLCPLDCFVLLSGLIVCVLFLIPVPLLHMVLFLDVVGARSSACQIPGDLS